MAETGCEHLNKRDFELLGRIFEAEIYGRLPAQLKSKRLTVFQEKGYIEPMTRTLGRDRFGAIEVSGWALTDAGRFTYCQNCTDERLRDG